MLRNDQNKKDVPGWNRLVELLSNVEQQADPLFTMALFRQVLLEMFRRQQSLKFSYPVPSLNLKENSAGTALPLFLFG
jgi:hypothetical protein